MVEIIEIFSKISMVEMPFSVISRCSCFELRLISSVSCLSRGFELRDGLKGIESCLVESNKVKESNETA